MIDVRLVEPAEDEMFAAIDFYDEASPGLGDEFIDEVERALDILAGSPRIGSPYERETRRLVLTQFPYALIYVFEDDEIVVLAVAHHRRRPDYWHDRAR